MNKGMVKEALNLVDLDRNGTSARLDHRVNFSICVDLRGNEACLISRRSSRPQLRERAPATGKLCIGRQVLLMHCYPAHGRLHPGRIADTGPQGLCRKIIVEPGRFSFFLLGPGRGAEAQYLGSWTCAGSSQLRTSR